MLRPNCLILMWWWITSFFQLFKSSNEPKKKGAKGFTHQVQRFCNFITQLVKTVWQLGDAKFERLFIRQAASNKRRWGCIMGNVVWMVFGTLFRLWNKNQFDLNFCCSLFLHLYSKKYVMLWTHIPN